MNRFSPLALAGALVATGISVLAASPSQAAARHVGYGDLDLASAEGRATMQHRLRNAAASVCWADYNNLSLIAACRREAMARANADLSRVVQTDVVQVAAR
jgi:UrcA family protein